MEFFFFFDVVIENIFYKATSMACHSLITLLHVKYFFIKKCCNKFCNQKFSFATNLLFHNFSFFLFNCSLHFFFSFLLIFAPFLSLSRHSNTSLVFPLSVFFLARQNVYLFLVKMNPKLTL